MNFRFIHVLIGSAFGAAFLGAACTYQPPTASTTGGEAGMGLGGAGGGSAGMGGSPGTGGGGMAGMGGTAGAGGQGGAGGGPITKWWNDAWQYRIKISFRNLGGDALKNFPVLVRLDEAHAKGIFNSSNGADLRFVDADGTTVLAHEIDGWNNAGNSFVWVKVPAIDASNTDYVWLYYGNPTATDGQAVQAVWNGFTAVYHMTPGTAAPEIPDSVGGHPGKWQKTAGSAMGSPINQATYFNGVGYVFVGENSFVAVNPNTARTIEAWVKPAMAQQNQHLVWQEGQCVGWHLSTTSTDSFWGHLITAPDQNDLCANTTEVPVNSLMMPQVWQYVTLVIDRPKNVMDLYVNGTRLNTVSIDNTGFTDGNGNFVIGADFAGDQAFIGEIDEVRVSTGSRSPKWIAAQHKSMTNAFLDIGSVQVP